MSFAVHDFQDLACHVVRDLCQLSSKVCCNLIKSVKVKKKNILIDLKVIFRLFLKGVERQLWSKQPTVYHAKRRWPSSVSTWRSARPVWMNFW